MGAAGANAQKKADADKAREAEEAKQRKLDEIKKTKQALAAKAQREAEELGIDIKSEGDLLAFAGGTADFDYVSSGLMGIRKAGADAGA